ncbi:MAG: amidohydrolase family protein [Caldithrix sp.]|nr:amidohydrolase family protein [Caldithrix sp.]
MSQKVIVRNGKLCHPHGIRREDILMQNGRIARIGKISENEYQSAEVIDAMDHYVLPGLIDMHTHVDDAINGVALADTYDSASRLAIQNGITTLFTFITQGPAESFDMAIDRAVRKAKGNSYTDVGWHLTPLDWYPPAMERIQTRIQEGFKTFKFYTTYKEAGLYLDYEQIAAIVNRLTKYNVRFLVHCEDEQTLETYRQKSWDLSKPESHADMRPPGAEYEAIRRIIEIAKRSGAKFHIVHVSTTEGLELIANEGRRHGITCETAPHYFLLNRRQLAAENGHRYLCTPPLRQPDTQRGMKTYAQEARFDCFATDHCAFNRKEKDRHKKNLPSIPKGIAGLGSLAPAVFELFHQEGDAGMIKLLKTLSENPARITGLYPQKGILQEGSDADVVILKKGNQSRPFCSSLTNNYEPYPDFETRLHIAYVIRNGEIKVKNNSIINNVMNGKLLNHNNQTNQYESKHK